MTQDLSLLLCPSNPITIRADPTPMFPVTVPFASLSSFLATLLPGLGHARLRLQPGLCPIHISTAHLPICPSL